MKSRDNIGMPSCAGSFPAMLGLLLAVSLEMLLCRSAIAATALVKPDGTGDFSTIQAALDAAQVGDTVFVAPGTYTGLGNRGLDFLGKDLALLSQAGAKNTIIDCEQQDRGFDFHSGETGAASVDGFTIQNGDGVGRGSGGGVRCIDSSSPSLRNLVVKHCYAAGGGGTYIADSSPNLDSLLVLENSDGLDSGGLHFHNSASVLQNAVVSGNSSPGQGAGVFCDGGSGPVFRNVVFKNNSTNAFGGGLAITWVDSCLIEDCVFEGNTAGTRGGGAYDGEGSRFLRCTFRENHSGINGGGLYIDRENTVVDSCLFAGNSSSYDGGGIATINAWATPTITNTTIVGNAAPRSAGIYCGDQTNPLIENCIIAFSIGGEGIYVPTYGDVTIHCSDVYGNEGGNYTGIPDQTGLNGNISDNPLFCDLEAGDYLLASESPCMPGNNDCEVLMGVEDLGCTLTGAPTHVRTNPQARNYPNPFNPTTKIEFTVEEAGPIGLTIHDVSGGLVRTLLSGRFLQQGRHIYPWDGRDDAGKRLSSGVYVYRIDLGGRFLKRKMLLLK